MVNSLSCAKVSHVNFTEVTAVNRAEVNAAVAVSAAVGSANHNQFASNNVMLSASNTASIGGNATSSNSPGLHEDDKTATVKMEVLDDLFGPGYGWETADNNITAAASTLPASTAAAAFSSLLMSPTSSSVATSKCTVKVPTESDFQAFSPQPPNLSAISLAAAAAMINEQPLRVVIPSPLPAGPDTTTATNSPIAAGASKTQVMAPTTPSSGSAASVAAASSSGKKTVFTAKGT